MSIERIKTILNSQKSLLGENTSDYATAVKALILNVQGVQSAIVDVQNGKGNVTVHFDDGGSQIFQVSETGVNQTTGKRLLYG